MTKEETKSSIVAGLQQNTIEVLINKLTEVVIENETLKARIAELEKPKT
jgi:hypothetical protein